MLLRSPDISQPETKMQALPGTASGRALAYALRGMPADERALAAAQWHCNRWVLMDLTDRQIYALFGISRYQLDRAREPTRTSKQRCAQASAGSPWKRPCALQASSNLGRCCKRSFDPRPAWAPSRMAFRKPHHG
jgi:hypothetical protein